MTDKPGNAPTPTPNESAGRMSATGAEPTMTVPTEPGMAPRREARQPTPPRRREKEIAEGGLYRNSRFKVRLTSYQTLGWRIFLFILIFAFVMLCGLVAWAVMTYPSIDDIVTLAGSGPETDRLQLWREAKAEWVQQLISVSQLALFGSLVPLLGTIAGYLLGQKAAAGSDDDSTI